MENKENKCGITIKMNPGETRKEYLARWQREYRKANKDKINKKLSEKRDQNPEKYKQAMARYYTKNRKKLHEKNKKWVEQNRGRVAEYMRDYRARNVEKRRSLNRRWKLKNNDAYRSRQRDYQNSRLKTDVLYKLIHISRMRMRGALRVKSNKKLHSTHELLGCTPAEFKSHLESRFDEKMSWDNYGDYWVIDHIRPIASFDLSISENQKAAFHYTNCQPMEKLANISKSDNYEHPIPETHALGPSSNTNNIPSYP